MKKIQCRIALTTDCNLQCDYCCMKWPEMLRTFKKINRCDLNNLDFQKYRSFVITGGEPTLDLFRLYSTLFTLRNKTDVPIYLHTNGILLDRTITGDFAFFNLVDGINISLHEDVNWNLSKIKMMNLDVPIRLHVYDKLVNQELLDFVKATGIILKQWELDECDTVPEDRLLLIGGNND